MYDVGSVRETEDVRRWVRMHGDEAGGTAPIIATVPRAHCARYCASWIGRKRGGGICGRSITDSSKRCGRTWAWFREAVK